MGVGRGIIVEMGVGVAGEIGVFGPDAVSDWKNEYPPKAMVIPTAAISKIIIGAKPLWSFIILYKQGRRESNPH